MTLSERQALRKTKMDQIQALLDAREQASREFTSDEAKSFDVLEAEVVTLNADIEREEKIERINKAKALDQSEKGKNTPEKKAAKQFSFAKAIDAITNHQKLSGLEEEMRQEADKELQLTGGLQGNLGVPSFMMNIKGKNVIGQTRDLTSGGSTTGDELVEDLPVGHIFGLNIMPKVMTLGATVLRGLTSDIHFTKTGTAAAVWETEVAAADETTPSTARVTLTPKRLAAFTDISRTLLTQASVVESYVRRELETAVNVALDAAAINGSGAAGQPTGILNFGTGVNTVAMADPDGGAPTRAKLIEMWKLIAEDNADIDTLAWLTTPGAKAKMWNTNLDTGSGRFLWEDESLLGYAAFTSNNVPSNLTKGAGTSLHALILGVWSQLLIGQWGGMDIIVDPYSRSKENIVVLVVNTNWDINTRHLQAFAHSKDLVVT